MKFPSITVPKVLVYVVGIVPWIIGIGFVVFILSLRFPVSGIFRATTNLTGTSAFIYQFLPAERTIIAKGDELDFIGQRMIEDPVYINARTPGPYEIVDVEMEFRVTRQPLVELGIIRDSAGKQMDMIPWYSELLESADWKHVTSPSGRKGFVYKTTSIGRLDNQDTRNLAVWLATTTAPLMDDPISTTTQTFAVSLRGQHDLWVVPAGGEINVNLKVQDVNRSRSGGLLAIEVSKNGDVIKYDAISPSGSLDDGYGARIPVSIKLNDLESGVYRIRLLADDDIFIREISTTNPRFVIGPRLNIGDVVGYLKEPQAFTGVTTARHIVAETFHTEGLQEIQFGETSGKVLQTHTATRIDRTDDIGTPVTIAAPLGDVRIITDGFVALTESAFFEPEPRRLKPETHGLQEGLEAVLTDYQPVTNLGDGWVLARATFQIPKQADMLRFVLSAPGIRSRAGSIDIRKMTLTYRRPPMNLEGWWNVLYNEARNAYHRL
ncbi:MAG: hypothetical protein P1P90_02430 [Patescibacteria group bacterium]|nr:hypothetical protein [Patescibacteria group bacterium]